MSALDGLPLGSAIVLAALLWTAGRIAAAVIEGRTFARRDGCLGELLHHVDSVGVGVKDTVTALEDITEHLAGIREAISEQGGS